MVEHRKQITHLNSTISLLSQAANINISTLFQFTEEFKKLSDRVVKVEALRMDLKNNSDTDLDQDFLIHCSFAFTLIMCFGLSLVRK